MDPELEPEILPHTAQREAGFTLVELLVAIAVLAVLALGASLALPRGAPPTESDMALFQRQFEQMRQLAITGQSSRGLRITPQGLQLARRQASAQTALLDSPEAHSAKASEPLPRWHVSARQQRWQGRVQFISQNSAGRAPIGSGAPDIQLLADGRSSAFIIRFFPRSGSASTGTGAQRASCRNDGHTGLICGKS